MKSEQKKREQTPSDRQVAVALGYEWFQQSAPIVLARGWDESAEKILKIAKENGVPLHEDADLAGLLVKLPVGMEIPPPLYEAVAEILAFIYRMNKTGEETR